MKRTLAVILAGGEGERLSILSSMRAKPAVPFGGKYRIIDFTLSNCVNSDIDNVVVLTQYNPRSLNDHIGMGRPWDLDRTNGGVRMLQPYIARGRVAEWYRGTADAVLQNLNVVEQAPGDTVLVLAGDHIYKMDYQPFVAAHRRHRADVTIAVRRVPLQDATRMGILAMDDAGRVVEWQEKPKQPKSDLASMGVYVFSKRALRQWLTDANMDFGHNVIPAMIDAGARVFGYRFDGYWQDVGTIQSYWEANLALLSDAPELDLYDREWVIHTRSEERAPAKIGATAQVHRSLISHGCVINGSVVNSILSPGVVVDVGAVVRDSIVMFDSVIRPGAVVDRAILDKEVSVGPGAIVGEGTDYDTPNRREPGRLNTGITLVGKQAVIPRGVRLGRNVLIAEGVRATDFVSRVVRSGSTVERPQEHATGGHAPARERGPRPAVARASDLRAPRRKPRTGRGHGHGDGATGRSDPDRRGGGGRLSAIPTAHDVERWLVELGLPALQRADREGVTSWDLRLDGRRRTDVRATLILDPSFAAIVWVHYAPAITDGLRASYRRLLRWNDEFPLVKFALAEDGRPILSTEVPIARLDCDELGLSLARVLAVCDALLDESAAWLWPGGRGKMTPPRSPAGVALLARYADRLGELAVVP